MNRTAPSSGQAAAAWRPLSLLVDRSGLPPGRRLALGLGLASLLALVALLLGPSATARAQTGSAQPARSTGQGTACVSAITVTSVADSGPSSLRQAIADVCDGGTIDFDAAMAGQTITLTTGELGISKTLTVANPNAAGLQVSGNNASRVFNIDASAVVTLSQLGIISGSLSAPSDGAGIYNSGTLVIEDSTISGNSTDSGAGGVYNDGMLTVNNSTISGNSAGAGGGIINYDGVLTVTNSTISGNLSDGAGGGGNGGGIFNILATLVMTNSTISGNSADTRGGGILNYFSALATVNNSTISNNTAQDGGGVYNTEGTLQLRNTIIANSANGGDCLNDGVLDANVSSLIEDGSCSPAFSGDPLLGLLADNGGPTQTHALLPGSPAIDVGEAAACPAADQRGVSRPQGNACDIGAFESRGFRLTAGGGSAQSTQLGTAFSQPLTLTVSSDAGEPVAGGQVIFSGPASGASINPARITATVGANGLVSAAVTANMEAGAYQVVAATRDAAPVAYALTNGRITTAVGLASAPAATVSGQAITFTAAVTAAVAGPLAPAGTVTFTANGADLGTAMLDAGGSAVFTTTELPVGSYTITATYGGDASHQAGISNSVTQVVNATIAVAATPAEGGAVSGGGVVAPGATVTVTATANPGYGFIAWQEGGATVATTPTYPFAAMRDRTLTAVFSALPTAVNDGAATLQGSGIPIAVLANDLDPAGQGLSVIGVTNPASGAVAIAAGAQGVTYTPDPAFSGMDTFTYRMRDANGLEDEALVVVVVTAQANNTDQPQAAAADAAVTSTLNLSSTQVSVEMTLPAGFYTGTLGVKDTFFFVFTRVMTPTADTGQNPGGLRFANLVFDLSAWRNGERLDPLTFSQPVTLVIRYDPALLGNLAEESLSLLFWNGSTWSSDGITVVARDPGSDTLVAVITHLSEFAFFAAAPTAEEPAVEPDVIPHLYLPIVGRGQ